MQLTPNHIVAWVEECAETRRMKPEVLAAAAVVSIVVVEARGRDKRLILELVDSKKGCAKLLYCQQHMSVRTPTRKMKEWLSLGLETLPSMYRPAAAHPE